MVSVVGVPNSAGSDAAGQDLAPAALRSAGLLERLTEGMSDQHVSMMVHDNVAKLYGLRV